jgi:hypothetical protein
MEKKQESTGNYSRVRIKRLFALLGGQFAGRAELNDSREGTITPEKAEWFH